MPEVPGGRLGVPNIPLDSFRGAVGMPESCSEMSNMLPRVPLECLNFPIGYVRELPRGTLRIP